MADVDLSQWRQGNWPRLPVETLIHHQQERYYDILGACDKNQWIARYS